MLRHCTLECTIWSTCYYQVFASVPRIGMSTTQHLYTFTLWIGMCNLINICMLRHCTLECTTWSTCYYRVFASVLWIGMWTTQCFWYFYDANWSAQLIKHFLSFLLIRFFSILLFFSCSLFWVLLEMILRCFYDNVFFFSLFLL
jgi:hypothetical protein